MKYRANGKLLLTGEYFVLKGAKSLAVPTNFGQTLEVKTSNGSEIKWSALDPEGNEWFNAALDLFNFKVEKTNNELAGGYLEKLIKTASRLNSDFLSQWKKYRITTTLDFNPNWGLGSSSTLIYLIAEWAELNPYELYFELSNGSGYDIACAYADGPIFYQYTGESIEIEETDFNPGFKDQLYFVYSGKKQNTFESLQSNAKAISKVKKKDIDHMNQITDQFVGCKNLKDFCKLIEEHENLVSKSLGFDDPIKQKYFSDFDGGLKSLGAWGGDFYLAASELPKSKIESYFKDKGAGPVLSLSDMLLQVED